MATATQSPDELLQHTIDRVVATGPTFLSGEIDADTMANTMVAAVTDYKTRQPKDAHGSRPGDPELQMVVREIYGCGAGYLAGMCDGACVARTITSLVDAFGDDA